MRGILLRSRGVPARALFGRVARAIGQTRSPRTGRGDRFERARKRGGDRRSGDAASGDLRQRRLPNGADHRLATVEQARLGGRRAGGSGRFGGAVPRVVALHGGEGHGGAPLGPGGLPRGVGRGGGGGGGGGVSGGGGGAQRP